MREHELFSLYCGDTLIEVWGQALSMDDITDYRIANTDVSVLEMIYELDKEGKFEQSVHERMYEVRNS
jgi:hypothetical protein